MKIARTLTLILLITVAILAAAAAIVLADRTLAPWWLFWGWAIAAAIILSIPLRTLAGRVTEWKNSTGNQIIAAIYITIVAAGGLYTMNYAFADHTTRHDENVVVERKFTRTRHRSRRVGRRYVRGDAYQVYFMQIRFTDGRTTELEISRNRYNRLRTGGTTTVNLATGLLGAPVINF